MLNQIITIWIIGSLIGYLLSLSYDKDLKELDSFQWLTPLGRKLLYILTSLCLWPLIILNELLEKFDTVINYFKTKYVEYKFKRVFNKWYNKIKHKLPEDEAKRLKDIIDGKADD
jgi:hypothetical protein